MKTGKASMTTSATKKNCKNFGKFKTLRRSELLMKSKTKTKAGFVQNFLDVMRNMRFGVIENNLKSGIRRKACSGYKSNLGLVQVNNGVKVAKRLTKKYYHTTTMQ